MLQCVFSSCSSSLAYLLQISRESAEPCHTAYRLGMFSASLHYGYKCKLFVPVSASSDPDLCCFVSNSDAGVPGIRGKIPVFTFSPQAMERAGMPSGAACNCPPFVVIASNDINQGMLNGEVPMYWPERAYKWGTAEAYNPEHSDLLALR